MNINNRNTMDRTKSTGEFVQSILRIFLNGEDNILGYVPDESHGNITRLIAERAEKILYPMLIINTHNKVNERFGTIDLDESKSGGLSQKDVKIMCDSCFNDIPPHTDYMKCKLCERERCMLYQVSLCVECEAIIGGCVSHGKAAVMVKRKTGDNSVNVIVDKEIYKVHFELVIN